MNYISLPFEAMGCCCEILLDTQDSRIAAEQRSEAIREALRIEKKYSRYLKGNIVDQINTSEGNPITVDQETAALLEFAAQGYALSGGLFDITTGVLRKIWRFKGEEHDLDPRALAEAKERMGWDKIRWEKPVLQMPSGFQIDFGGICKEYAADRILNLLIQRHPISTLVNLGGDIAAYGDRDWAVGIENPVQAGTMIHTLYLKQGAVATSGTARRFTKVGGVELGHILNPKTGWPVEDAPRSVTVAAKTCTEAGFWSTLAILQGAQAESFLKEQSLESWCYRSAS